MAIFSRLIFETVKWRARRGLSGGEESVGDEKEVARRRGVRDETFAYLYLRRYGYVFVARNYVPRGAKGEIDLVGTTATRWRLLKCARGRRARIRQRYRN